MSLVRCDRVGNALSKWADNATPEEKDALREALGYHGDGGDAPAISGAAGNVVERYPDGLFVKEASWQAKEW